jgi:TonB family protein
MDAVSELLVDRSREAGSLSRMVMVSLAAHVAIVAAISFVPRPSSVAQDQRRVMTIVLSGAEGPDQGRNPTSARQVQETVPESAKPRDTPPAPPKPEMIEPAKTAPAAAKANTKPEPPKPAPQLQGRAPSQGPEVTKGTARIETNSTTQTPFGGLATGGGGPGAYTDYADFCCPEYLAQVVATIKRNWQRRQGQVGQNVAKFTIARDGTINNVTIEKPGNQLLDLASQRALLQTRSVAPLPAAFTPAQLTVYLIFEYER